MNTMTSRYPDDRDLARVQQELDVLRVPVAAAYSHQAQSARLPDMRPTAPARDVIDRSRAGRPSHGTRASSSTRWPSWVARLLHHGVVPPTGC